jgi:hypothetical protein
MNLRTFLPCCVAALLTACGGDVASTALTAAQLQAEQVRQAKALEAQFKEKLGEAMQATAAAASAAADQ